MTLGSLGCRLCKYFLKVNCVLFTCSIVLQSLFIFMLFKPPQEPLFQLFIKKILMDTLTVNKGPGSNFCVGVLLILFLGLINNFGMSSVIQRQNIKLADLVLMAIADLNSMKLLASPSTIQQHLESKEWFKKKNEIHKLVQIPAPPPGLGTPDWAHKGAFQNCSNVRMALYSQTD